MTAARTSTTITSLSAAVLAIAGVALLFASDSIVPRIVAGAPPAATVLGQMIAAGWLAVAWLNWMQRQTIVGGIYGRSTVLANFALYFISGFSLARPAMASGAPVALQGLALVFCLFALVYAALLMRGPFGSIAAAA